MILQKPGFPTRQKAKETRRSTSHIPHPRHLARLAPIRARDENPLGDGLHEQRDGRARPQADEVPVQAESRAERDGEGDLDQVSASSRMKGRGRWTVGATYGVESQQRDVAADILLS